MGQGYKLGGFAVQFYLTGLVRTSYLSGCSLHHSFQRGLVLHKADGLRVDGNVFYHIVGHHFHMEGGVETENKLTNNIGILALKSSIWADDMSPAIFSMTNPTNYFEGNVAVGSEGHGFHLMFFESPGGGCCASTKKIQFEPLGSFDGNLGHSNGIDGLFIDGHHSKDGATVMRGFVGYNNWRCGTMVAIVSKHMYYDFVLHGNRVSNLMVSDANGDWGTIGVNGALIVQAADQAAWTARGLGDAVQVGLGLSTSHRFSVKGVSFVGYQAPHIALMPCAAAGGCGAQGGFEQRFEGMKFLNCSRRTMVQDQFEIIWHDLDGSLAAPDVNPAYRPRGAVVLPRAKGVLLAESPITPWEHCSRASSYKPYGLSSLPLVRCDASAVTFRRVSVRLAKGSATGNPLRLYWGNAAHPAPPVPTNESSHFYQQSVLAAALLDKDGVNSATRPYSDWLRPYAWEKGLFGEFKPPVGSGRKRYGTTYPNQPNTHTTQAYTFIMHMGARMAMKWDGHFPQLHARGDCCRYNKAQVAVRDFGSSGTLAQCESLCSGSPRCKYFSHAVQGTSGTGTNYYHRCMLCSACEVSGNPPGNAGEGRFFKSYQKVHFKELSSYQVVVSEVTQL
jgi:hypothetical protein